MPKSPCGSSARTRNRSSPKRPAKCWARNLEWKPKMKKTKVESGPLSPELLRRMNAYWRAANYLSVGQIYLLDNPLLRKPLTLGHIKPRLLGHWGTTPGLNFVYVHLNRIIRQHDVEMMYVAGPGHG